MTTSAQRIVRTPRVVSASRVVAAPADELFDLVADPARQPEWDGNDNLLRAEPDQRVHGVGDVFVMTLKSHMPGTPTERENVVVEFAEGLLIAWTPRVPGQQCPGHLWRWEFDALADGTTRVTHTYDWSALDPSDERRIARACATTEQHLAASIERLARMSEGH